MGVFSKLFKKGKKNSKNNDDKKKTSHKQQPQQTAAAAPAPAAVTKPLAQQQQQQRYSSGPVDLDLSMSFGKSNSTGDESHGRMMAAPHHSAAGNSNNNGAIPLDHRNDGSFGNNTTTTGKGSTGSSSREREMDNSMLFPSHQQFGFPLDQHHDGGVEQQQLVSHSHLSSTANSTYNNRGASQQHQHQQRQYDSWGDEPRLQVHLPSSSAQQGFDAEGAAAVSSPRLSQQHLQKFNMQQQQQQQQQLSPPSSLKQQQQHKGPVFTMSSDVPKPFTHDHRADNRSDDASSSSFNLSTDAEDSEYEGLRQRRFLPGMGSAGVAGAGMGNIPNHRQNYPVGVGGALYGNNRHSLELSIGSATSNHSPTTTMYTTDEERLFAGLPTDDEMTLSTQQSNPNNPPQTTQAQTQATGILGRSSTPDDEPGFIPITSSNATSPQKIQIHDQDHNNKQQQQQQQQAQQGGGAAWDDTLSASTQNSSQELTTRMMTMPSAGAGFGASPPPTSQQQQTTTPNTATASRTSHNHFSSPRGDPPQQHSVTTTKNQTSTSNNSNHNDMDFGMNDAGFADFADFGAFGTSTSTNNNHNDGWGTSANITSKTVGSSPRDAFDAASESFSPQQQSSTPSSQAPARNSLSNHQEPIISTTTATTPTNPSGVPASSPDKLANLLAQANLATSYSNRRRSGGVNSSQQHQPRQSSSSVNSAPAFTSSYLRQHHNLRSAQTGERYYSDQHRADAAKSSLEQQGASVADIIQNLEASERKGVSNHNGTSSPRRSHHSLGDNGASNTARLAKERLRERRRNERIQRNAEKSSSDDSDNGEPEKWLFDEVTSALGPRGVAADLESLSGRSKSSTGNISSRSQRSFSRRRKQRSSNESLGSKESRNSRYSHRSTKSFLSQMSEQSRSVANDLLRLEMQLAMVGSSSQDKRDDSHSRTGGSVSGTSLGGTSRTSRGARKSYGSSRSHSYSNSTKQAIEMSITRKTRVTVEAPPGKLGIILANKADSKGTVVSGVRSTSVLADKISAGDRIVAIDGEDVSRMTVSEITTIMARKSDFDRTLTILTSAKDGDGLASGTAPDSTPSPSKHRPNRSSSFNNGSHSGREHSFENNFQSAYRR